MRVGKINIESSTFCNARCLFCPRYEMTRPMGEMSDELFHKIIKDGKDMGVKSYSPFMNGEPFVFPKIWEWLDYMEKEGVSVSLYTNGEFVDVDRLVKYKNIQYLDFSINATTEETYNKVMRGPNFKRVVDNYFLARKKAKFMVRASFVKCEENIHEIEDFRKMFKRVQLCGYSNWTGDRVSPLARTGKKIPCWVLFHQMFVLWDGRVVLCCMEYNCKMPVGDANKQTLKEIWDDYAWIREKHARGEWDDIPICKSCNYNVESKL